MMKNHKTTPDRLKIRQEASSSKDYIISNFQNGRISLKGFPEVKNNQKLVCTRFFDSSLVLYFDNEFEQIITGLNNLKLSSKDSKTFVALMISGAKELVVKNNKVTIPEYLVDYAQIKRQAVILKLENTFEIWSIENINNYFKSNKILIDFI